MLCSNFSFASGPSLYSGIYGLPYSPVFLAEIKRRRESKELNELLSDIQQSLGKHNEAINESTKAQKEGTQATHELLAKLDLPRTEKTHQILKTEQRNPLEWIKLAVEIAAFFIVAAYTTLTALQLYVADKSATAAETAAEAAESAAITAHDTLVNSQKTFEVDERPYLVTESQNPVFALHGLVANQKLSVNINFKNIGKSPAVHQILEMHLVKYTDPAKAGEKLSPQGYKANIRTFTDKWFDKMRRDAKTSLAEITAYHQGHGEDVAPNDSWFASTSDGNVVTPDEVKEIMNDTDARMDLLLFIVITYKDRFGNSYETDACRMYWGSRPEIWHRSPVYNIIK